MAKFGHVLISGLLWIAIAIAVGLLGSWMTTLGGVWSVLGWITAVAGYGFAALSVYHLWRVTFATVMGMRMKREEPERSAQPPVGVSRARRGPSQADEVANRIRRIYAAIGAAEERDLTKLPAQVVDTDRVKAVFQDFSGGLSDEELANLAHSYIHNIANLRDNLKRWAARSGHDKSKVDTAFDRSDAIKTITDLSNLDKHGPRRDGRGCRLGDIGRNMQLTTKAEKGSKVVMTLGLGGIPKISGSGSGVAVITAEIIDADGNVIGDLHETALRAVNDWEQILNDYGVSLEAARPCAPWHNLGRRVE